MPSFRVQVWLAGPQASTLKEGIIWDCQIYQIRQLGTGWLDLRPGWMAPGGGDVHIGVQKNLPILQDFIQVTKSRGQLSNRNSLQGRVLIKIKNTANH